MSDIFHPKKQNETSKQTLYYTIVGKQTGFDEDNNPTVESDTSDVLAKKIISDAKSRFYIKIGPFGKIYNPIGIFSEGRGNKYLKKAGKEEWPFEEVNNRVFNLYLSFLRTKNQAHLNMAERELH
jgi:hypothetical protein